MNELRKYDVAIIVLNYRTPKLVIECLHAMKVEVINNNFHVIVVDNNSADGSVEDIRRSICDNNWNNWVELVQSSSNGGFSSGNNLGISSVVADYYLLLNSDTLVTRGVISALLDFSLENPKIGILSPSLIWPNGKLQTSAFRNITPISELISAANTGIITSILKKYVVPMEPKTIPIYCDWVCFACVLIKSKVLADIGKLDEKYFMYFEDVDYCRKAKTAGFEVSSYPAARVVHFNGGSSGINNKFNKNKRRPNYFYESRATYFKRFYGMRGLLLANIFWTIGWIISLFREAINKKQSHIAEGEFFSIWSNFNSIE